MTEKYTIICPEWLVCVDSANRVLQDHAVVLEGDTIVAINPVSKLDQWTSAKRVDLPSHTLMPGLINSHTHQAMTLMRGYADDLPLMSWLTEHIWPAERQFVDRQFVADGTRLAIAESLRGGVTCFNDMYFFPDVVAEVARESGIRASIGLIALDFPTVWAQDAAEYIEKGLQLLDELHGQPLQSCMFAPHAPYTVSAEPLARIADLATERNIGVHIHVHETVDEIVQFERQHGLRPIARLHELGLLNSRLSAVHMTQLTDSELQLVAEHNCNVLHCPESNLKLASGFAPVATMQQAGINVAVGTDGAASNNNLDMLGELRSAAMIGKCCAGDAAALPAAEVLRMGTINAAKALGIDAITGSIETGKQADLVAVNFDRPELQPVFDPVSHLIYACSRDDVNHVWVAGKQLLADAELTSIDQQAVVANARQWGEKLASVR